MNLNLNLNLNLNSIKKKEKGKFFCTGRDSNSDRPRGRRAFYP